MPATLKSYIHIEKGFESGGWLGHKVLFALDSVYYLKMKFNSPLTSSQYIALFLFFWLMYNTPGRAEKQMLSSLYITVVCSWDLLLSADVMSWVAANGCYFCFVWPEYIVSNGFWFVKFFIRSEFCVGCRKEECFFVQLRFLCFQGVLQKWPLPALFTFVFWLSCKMKPVQGQLLVGPPL